MKNLIQSLPKSVLSSLLITLSICIPACVQESSKPVELPPGWPLAQLVPPPNAIAMPVVVEGSEEKYFIDGEMRNENSSYEARVYWIAFKVDMEWSDMESYFRQQCEDIGSLVELTYVEGQLVQFINEDRKTVAQMTKYGEHPYTMSIHEYSVVRPAP